MRASFESIPMMTRVNVTPIIDVALVLVIILLITAPILSVADLEVNVPQAHTREAEDEHRVLITLGRTGDLALDEEILSRAGLRGELFRRLKDDPDALVVVRADQSMPYERVADLLALSREAGATRLAVASRQKGTQ
jgi:biopolymer transport protein ExbD